MSSPHSDDLPPQVVAALTPADLERLHRQVLEAHAAARVELDAALDSVISFVPRWIRGRTRALLVGHR
ncbi:MAG TPA: hypothetical protein VEY14_08260 [Nocardioidaceae bacterium]|nr:hypothetical protein [Nocardioidaceae bacterium]